MATNGTQPGSEGDAGAGQFDTFPGAAGMPLDSLADSSLDLTKGAAKAHPERKAAVDAALSGFKQITRARTDHEQPQYLKLSKLGFTSKTELIKAIDEAVPDSPMWKIANKFTGFKVIPLMKSEPEAEKQKSPTYYFALRADEVNSDHGAAEFWYKVQMYLAEEITNKLGVPLSQLKFVLVDRKILSYLNRLVDPHDGQDTRQRALIKEMESADTEVFSERKLTQYGSKTEATKLFVEIFTIGVKIKATDIHIEPDEPERYMVRYRVNGQLIHWDSISQELAESISAIIKNRSQINPSERRMPHDGRLTFLKSDLAMAGSLRQIDVRVSTVPLCNGESMVLRLLEKNKSEASFDLEDLGFPRRIITDIREMLRRPNGLVIVAGPTGSGKTTSLYSILRELDDGTRKIVTVEDPVEMDLRGLSQSQVRRNPANDDHDLSFNKLLRATLRQDPDVILVGEIRDAETAEIAVRAALTGHLVFSTLHTNDSFAVVKRLISQGVSQNLLQGCLRGVISQRLVPVLCDKCKVQVEDPSAVLFKQTGLKIPNPTLLPLYAPTISNEEDVDCCEECHGSGFNARAVVPEIWTVSDQVLNEIFTNKNLSDTELYALAREEGFIPMIDVMVDLIAQGKTTFEKAIGIACSRDQLSYPAVREKIATFFGAELEEESAADETETETAPAD